MPVVSLSYLFPKFLTSLSEALFHCPSVYPLHPGDTEVSITIFQLPLSPADTIFSCYSCCCLDSRQQMLNPKCPRGVQEVQFHSTDSPAHSPPARCITLASSVLARSFHLHWQNVLKTKAQAPTNQIHFLGTWAWT